MKKKQKELTLTERVQLKHKEEKIKEDLDLEKETTIVIEKKSFFSTFVRVFSNIIVALIKFTIILCIIILSTIGATVLFQSDLRNALIELITITFFN